MAPSQFRKTAETTHSPLLIDYHDQTSSYCRDRPTAVTHQRPRSPAVNDTKEPSTPTTLKRADGAVPPSKGGGDGGGTPPGKGDKDGGGGGDDPAKKSQEAHERARTAKNELPAGNEQKTTSSDHVKTLSGWSKDRPDGFQEPNVDDVLAKQEEIGHPVKSSGCRDHGVDGQQLASHAERQLSLTAKEPYIGVSKKVCSDCRGYFSKLAQYEKRDWYVTDPDGTWIFRADGSVDSPN